MGAALMATTMTMGTQVLGGVASMSAAQDQADLQRSYADMQKDEHYREALRIEDEGNRFAQKQKTAYIGSGVQIGGSAAVTIAQTKKWAASEAESMRRRGRAIQTFGHRSADITENQGTAAFFSGLMSAGGSLFAYMHTQKPVLQGGVQDDKKRLS